MKYLTYRADVKIHVQTLAVVDVQVALLPIPSIVLDFVELVVQVSSLKVIDVYEVSPFQPVGDIHVHVIVPHVGAECHVCVQKVVDVRRFRLGIVNDIATDKILEHSREERKTI